MTEKTEKASEASASGKDKVSSPDVFDKAKDSSLGKYIMARPFLKSIVFILIILLIKLVIFTFYSIVKDRTVSELEQKGIIEKTRNRRTVDLD